MSSNSHFLYKKRSQLSAMADEMSTKRSKILILCCFNNGSKKLAVVNEAQKWIRRECKEKKAYCCVQ